MATGNRQVNFYNETLARTRDGNLELLFSNEPKTFTTDPGKTAVAPIQSAMLQTWNKFCFSGGIVEMRAKLPGQWDKPGLWPGFWMMGNLCVTHQMMCTYLHMATILPAMPIERLDDAHALCG